MNITCVEIGRFKTKYPELPEASSWFSTKFFCWTHWDRSGFTAASGPKLNYKLLHPRSVSIVCNSKHVWCTCYNFLFLQSDLYLITSYLILIFKKTWLLNFYIIQKNLNHKKYKIWNFKKHLTSKLMRIFWQLGFF